MIDDVSVAVPEVPNLGFLTVNVRAVLLEALLQVVAHLLRDFKILVEFLDLRSLEVYVFVDALNHETDTHRQIRVASGGFVVNTLT